MNRISDLEQQYVLDVLGNQFRTSKNSIYNNKMEAAFAKIFNSKFAIGHVNGTATLHSALHALNVKQGDEVIVPPLTMASTSLAVLHNNSTPVFADVDNETFNISSESINDRITEKTKAIITVALFGLAPDYDRILKICKDNGIHLIEDNAQCFLGKYKGKLIGEFGDFASYSFQASKHLTAGEGGMLTTNNELLADNARKFSSLGYSGVEAKKGKITKEDIQNPNYDRHISIGYNYRMSELQAAVVLGQLERIDELVNCRIETARIFDDVILAYPELFTKQKEPADYQSTYWAYSMILNTDKPEVDWFHFRDIFSRNGGDSFYAAWKLTYFEPLFQNIIQYQNDIWQNYSKGLCPNAEFIQPRLIQLKTNYWNLDDAKKQAEILEKSILEFKG
jgi:perosamine synthetase